MYHALPCGGEAFVPSFRGPLINVATCGQCCGVQVGCLFNIFDDPTEHVDLAATNLSLAQNMSVCPYIYVSICRSVFLLTRAVQLPQNRCCFI